MDISIRHIVIKISLKTRIEYQSQELFQKDHVIVEIDGILEVRHYARAQLIFQ